MNLLRTIVEKISYFIWWILGINTDVVKIDNVDGGLTVVHESPDEEPVPPKGRDIKEGVQPPKPNKSKKVTKKKNSKKKASKKKASKKKNSKKKEK